MGFYKTTADNSSGWRAILWWIYKLLQEPCNILESNVLDALLFILPYHMVSTRCRGWIVLRPKMRAKNKIVKFMWCVGFLYKPKLIGRSILVYIGKPSKPPVVRQLHTQPCLIYWMSWTSNLSHRKRGRKETNNRNRLLLNRGRYIRRTIMRPRQSVENCLLWTESYTTLLARTSPLWQ